MGWLKHFPGRTLSQAVTVILVLQLNEENIGQVLGQSVRK